MPVKRPFNRVVLIVLDSAGIGEMPDAADYGDAGSDTIGHTLNSREVKIPNLQQLGLANISRLALEPVEKPTGAILSPPTSFFISLQPPTTNPQPP